LLAGEVLLFCAKWCDICWYANIFFCFIYILLLFYILHVFLIIKSCFGVVVYEKLICAKIGNILMKLSVMHFCFLCYTSNCYAILRVPFFIEKLLLEFLLIKKFIHIHVPVARHFYFYSLQSFMSFLFLFSIVFHSFKKL
jgi:hypothetical protein